MKEFSPISRYVSDGKFPIKSGIVPDKELELIEKLSSAVRSAISDGKVPLILCTIVSCA